MTSTVGLGDYYDRLSVWTRLARTIGHGGGDETLTVHRRLADPAAAGRATTTRLHDLLFTRLPGGASRVLDAGCGLGGTMLDLASRHGARFTGVTLSGVQAARGRAAIARRQLGARVSIHVQDYDRPPAGPFDAILAIESLAHSRDPAATLAALTAVLSPTRGARMLIVDDMPLAAAEGRPDLETFKRGWRCPVLWSRAQYAARFASLGLELVEELDLTADVRPRGLPAIVLLGALNRAAHRLVPHAGWRALMDSHCGGLALEQLYRDGAMGYRLLVAARP